VEYLLQPIAIWIAMAAGLLSCLMLFLSLKREADSRDAIHRRSLAEAEARWKQRIEELESRSRELTELTQVFVAPPPTPSGLNLNKRSQALQMHRRGEPAERIAAALSVPRNEVDLLLKVHAIMISSIS
jgi:hypothetical protein